MDPESQTSTLEQRAPQADKDDFSPSSKDSDCGVSDTENSISEQQNGLKHSDSTDSMPDLIWPEKKSSGRNVKPSESRDTGFSSDSVAETPSPVEEGKIVRDSPGDENETTQDNGGTEENSAEDDVMDILGNGLLTKKVLSPGKGEDTRPNNGDTVTIKADGLLEDGTHIDVQDFKFILGDGDVIVAFDIAVALMEAGEKCELKTAPRYAYDELGREPDIPKDASITYTLELVDIQPPTDPASLGYEQRLQMGETKRERGNYLYGRQDYSGAINSYTKAVKLLDDSDLNAGLDEASRCLLSESWVKCYNNMAACQLKISAFDAAIRSCEKVLAIQEDNVKALFRLGKAFGSKNEVDEALKYLKKAVKLDPESKMLHQEVLNLTRRKSKETDSERELYKRMLGVKHETGTSEKHKSSHPIKKWALLMGGVAAVVASMGMAYYRMS